MPPSSDFVVRFWGVRGSIPSPGPETARYGGNTTCIEVRCGDHLMIFDAGTGIRPFGSQLAAEAPLDLDLFFTHTHYDHVAGLPFFAPAFDPRNRLRLWAGHLPPPQTIRSVLCDMMIAPLFPVPLSAFDHSCTFNDFQCGATLTPGPGITLRTGPLNHPNQCCGYRVEYEGRVLAIVTDTEHRAEGPDPAVLDLARGADVMVYDGMYTDAVYPRHVGWGHSTWQEGCRVADAAGVGRAVIFHHEPNHDDSVMDGIAAEAEAMRPGTLVAYEGMILNL
ncbi:MBL fold metallo-hydrolase [Skermanella sp. TT6]|uniref:MBL fold metallo-hydrolase n=2 Tax=Skermanella cutis TaxID=2775420 RepID=A0ABX7B4Z2_9PROT|nr:MBL fold metallo-hydrolase [Skermanella sp. TT6]QQP89413.1 MBL fold metallo-hydrolase [Skermanella sp. TT6]